MTSPENKDDSARTTSAPGQGKGGAQRLWTEKFFLNLAASGAFGDERLTPAVFQELATTFTLSMTQLGLLSFAGLIASSLTYPLSGAVGDAYYRGRIVLWSLAGIAVTTVMMALAQGYAFLVVSKTLNGVAIGMLVPSLQALLGDIHSAADRGKAFGAMNFTGITGSIVAGTLATVLAAGIYWGLEGWRLAFLIWTAYLLLIIVGYVLFAADSLDNVDASRGEEDGELASNTLSYRAASAWVKFQAVLSVPTLQVIIIPQAVGLLPWMALTGWATFYLEALGFTNTTSAVLMLFTGIGFATGSLLGGILGDLAEAADYYRGRIALAQLTILLGTGMFIFILQVLPWLLDGADMLVASLAYAAALSTTGVLSIGGTGAACNLPIILSCLPTSTRTSGVAVERFFGSILGSMAVPLIAVICENYFGYRMEEDIDDLTDINAPASTVFRPYGRRRAVVLASALTIVTVVCWLFCIAIWSVLYVTYPTDRLSETREEEEEVLGQSTKVYGTVDAAAGSAT